MRNRVPLEYTYHITREKKSWEIGILSETVQTVDTGDYERIAFTVEYNGQILSDGALRTRGLRNGDPVTVVGRKADGGGIVPSYLIGGGREQLVAYFRAEARYQAFLRVAGVVMMIFSPFLAVIIWHEFD